MSHQRYTRRVIQTGLLTLLLWLACYFYVIGMPVSDPSFQYMRHLASERAWSALFLIAANVGGFGLLSHNQAIQLVGVLVVATTLGVVAGCLLLSAEGIWSGTFVIIALMGYYLAYDVTRETVQAASDARHRA